MYDILVNSDKNTSTSEHFDVHVWLQFFEQSLALQFCGTHFLVAAKSAFFSMISGACVDMTQRKCLITPIQFIDLNHVCLDKYSSLSYR